MHNDVLGADIRQKAWARAHDPAIMFRLAKFMTVPYRPRCGYSAQRCSDRVTFVLEVASVERRRYPDVVTALRDDETALLTVWQAHTSVRCRCPDDGSCEARQALEDAIAKIQELVSREGG
jgi:hypothetical protein